MKRTRLTSGLMLGAVSAVLLSGCIAGPPAPAPAPTPTASAAAVPVHARHNEQSYVASPLTTAFDHGCKDVMSPTSAAHLVATDAKVRLSTQPLGDWMAQDTTRAIILNNSGMRCDWVTTDGASVIDMVLFPSALAGIGSLDDCKDAEPSSACTAAYDTGQVSYVARIVAHDPADADHRLRSVVARAVNLLTAVPALRADDSGNDTGTSAWAFGTTCADVRAMLGDGWRDADDTEWKNGNHADAGDATSVASRVAVRAEEQRAAGAICTVFGPKSSRPLVVSVLPGASWMRETIAETTVGADATVRGADAARRLDGDVGRQLVVADGYNAIVLRTRGPVIYYDLEAIAGTLAARLDARMAASTPARKGDQEPLASALAGLTLTSEGLGDLRVGSPVPQGSTTATWTSGFCPAYDGEPASAGREWVPGHRTVADPIPYFLVSSVHGPRGLGRDEPIGSIFITSPDIRTPHGLHIGSTKAQVMALGGTPYPSSSWPQNLVIPGATGQLLFELDSARVVGIIVTLKGAQDPSGFGLCD